MGQAPQGLDVKAVSFMSNPLVLIAPADHPLAAMKNISPKRLAGEFFIMREQGSGTRLAAERFFSQHGVDMKTRMTLGSNEAVKQAVVGGLGIALLSRHTLILDASSGAFAVLDVRGFPLVRQWYAVYPVGKRLKATTAAFLHYLDAAAESVAR
jgi:DNA-binding transcriptional LysR family regulator